MRLVWTIKVYDTGGIVDPIRVKIEGTPYGYDQPLVNSSGKGPTQTAAYLDATSKIKSGTKPAIFDQR